MMDFSYTLLFSMALLSLADCVVLLVVFTHKLYFVTSFDINRIAAFEKSIDER